MKFKTQGCFFSNFWTRQWGSSFAGFLGKTKALFEGFFPLNYGLAGNVIFFLLDKTPTPKLVSSPWSPPPSLAFCGRPHLYIASAAMPGADPLDNWYSCGRSLHFWFRFWLLWFGVLNCCCIIELCVNFCCK